MATYKIIGKRFLRKYTESGTSPVYAAAAQAQHVVDTFCDVPWEAVRPSAATMTYHTDEVLDEDEGVTGLDKNVLIRDRFDAALFCAGHSGGQHRAYANAACYRYTLPDEAVGETLESLALRVTSDPYNSEGARIHVFTNSTGEIPTNCHDCRGEDSSGDVIEDGTTAAGVAKRTVKNVSGTDYWYPTTATVTLEPTGGLTLQKYLFVVVALESYSTVRGNWLEGCSFIENKVSITTASAVDGWDDGDTVDLAGSDYVSILAGGTTPTWIEPPTIVDVGSAAPAVPGAAAAETFFAALPSTVDTGSVKNIISIPFSIRWHYTVNGADHPSTFSGAVQLVFNGTVLESATLGWSLLCWSGASYFESSGQVNSMTISDGTISPVTVGDTTYGYTASMSTSYGVALNPSAKTMVVSVNLVPSCSRAESVLESSGLSYASDALVYAPIPGATSELFLMLKTEEGAPVDADICTSANASSRLNFSADITAPGEGETEYTVDVGNLTGIQVWFDAAEHKVKAEYSGQSWEWASAAAPGSETTYFDASVVVAESEAVKRFGLAAAVADFTAAVSTFEASTSPGDGELLGRLVRMSKSGAGAMATLHPATAALAAELDALRTLPRFIRGGSAPSGAMGQPGLSAWYHRPSSGSTAAMGYAKVSGETVLASVVTDPVFLQFALLALRSTGVLEEELVLSNASGASIHNDFKLRFVAWRSDAALWDKSNSFALAAFANLPSVYRSDGPGSVDWTVECSGSLFPFGTRQMSADRVGVSGVVSGDIADGEKIAIALDRPVGEGDVILIAPEVVGFAAAESGDAYFGNDEDPSDEVSGFVWARETYNIGWFPKIDGR